VKSLSEEEIQSILNERMIDKTLIEGYRVKLEELQNCLKCKDKTIEKREKQIDRQSQKIESLNNRIETLKDNLPIQIEKELGRITEEITKKILREKLQIEIEKHNESIFQKLKAILKEAGMKINSNSLYEILKEIPEYFEKLYTVEKSFFNNLSNLRNDIDNLRNDIDKSLKWFES
jgi:hypothetical protein